MSWFENLKEFIKVHLGFNINVTDSNLIKIQINSNNNSNIYEYDEKNNFLSVNLNRLEHAGLQEFGKITKELFEDSVFLENSSQERVVDIESKEESEDVQQLLAYFRDKIPPLDFHILRQAAYIKKTFEEKRNPEIIFRLKGEVIKKYGRHGLNICNLYSSGYFDTIIKPMYEEMAKHGLDEKVFLEIYNLLINEEAFAVFVSGNMSFPDVKNIIEKKIRRNKRYGLRSVTIHGIGKNNVKKIRDFISEFEDVHIDINKVVEEKGNIILARLIWPP